MTDSFRVHFHSLFAAIQRITVTSPSLASAQRLLHSAEAAARAQTEQVRRKSAGCLQISHGQLEFISPSVNFCKPLEISERAGKMILFRTNMLHHATKGGVNAP